MKKITIIWTITLILILTGLTLFGFKMKAEIINELMEEAIVKETQKYLKKQPNLYPKLKQNIKISVSKLIEEEYNPELEENCDGYIIVENTEMGFTYSPYIKCPEYTTDGYIEEERKENKNT